MAKAKASAGAPARKWPAGMYLIERDRTLALGPGDRTRWVAVIRDLDGDRPGCLTDLEGVDEKGRLAEVIVHPYRSGTAGVGWRYLDRLEAAGHYRISLYKKPKAASKSSIDKLIASMPKACWRTVDRELTAHIRGGTKAMATYASKALLKARPDCGYDCDGRCPVSGRPEE
jgi:hypothetical protein